MDHFFEGNPYPAEMEMVLFSQYMGGRQDQSQHRRAPCGQRRSENSQIHGKDKNIVQQDIQEASAEHAQHGQPWGIIIAHKGDECIIQDKKGRKAEYRPQIYGRHVQNMSSGSKQMGQIPGINFSCRKNCQSNDHSPENSLGKYLISLFYLLLFSADHIPCSAADAQHQPDPVDKVKAGYGNIQRRQSIAPQSG